MGACVRACVFFFFFLGGGGGGSCFGSFGVKPGQKIITLVDTDVFCTVYVVALLPGSALRGWSLNCTIRG